MGRDIQELPLESSRDRSTGHWGGKQPPLDFRAPLRKANLRLGVFTLAQPEADRWSAKWICYCLVCLGSPWERHTDCCPRCLQYAHTITDTYTHSYRNVWLIFSHLFSLLLWYSIACLQTFTISPNHFSRRGIATFFLLFHHDYFLSLISTWSSERWKKVSAFI